MRYAVVHGRRSGRGGAARLGRTAVARLRQAGQDVVELEAASYPEARQRCADAIASGVDVLVVAGGDGVVSMATDLLATTPTALGILPAGSGNDNARSLGIPLDVDGAVEVLLTDHRRTLDTLHLPDVDRHVMASLNTGLDARIAHRATRLPRRLGAASYTVAALVEIARLARTEPLRFTVEAVEADGSRTSADLEALVVVPANMPYLGGGLRLAPEADPEDGLLDLVVIRPVGPLEATRLLREVRRGRHTTLPCVETRRVREVRLTGPQDVVVHGDGEAIGPLPVTARVAPRSLQVVAPQVT